MSVESIERDFKAKGSNRIRLMSEGVDRYQVFTPFVFDDGDHLVIVLKRQNSHWVLSDEGHTYMHLTYKMDEKDLQRGTRQTIITNALSMFDVNDRGGELAVESKMTVMGTLSTASYRLYCKSQTSLICLVKR